METKINMLKCKYTKSQSLKILKSTKKLLSLYIYVCV